jgi:cytoskeletal protein RodZ
MFESQKQAPLTADPSVHWGSRFMLARQARGWSIDNVAIQLKIKPEQVMAIESEDTRAICPDSLFVKAYLRNYATLLGLSEQSLSDIVISDTSKTSLHSVNHVGETFKQQPARASLSRFWRWVVGVSLVLVAIWQMLINTQVISFLSGSVN